MPYVNDVLTEHKQRKAYAHAYSRLSSLAHKLLIEDRALSSIATQGAYKCARIGAIANEKSCSPSPQHSGRVAFFAKGS